jgi:hypothetical protein
MAQWTYQTSAKVIRTGSCPVCPSSDGYKEYEDGHSHCYVCSHHIHAPTTLETLKSFLHIGKNKVGPTVNLPKDFDKDWFREDAQAWIDKYDLRPQERRRNRLGWSESLESLVFPVFEFKTSTLLMYQARYFGTDEQAPKWRTKGPKQEIIHLPDRWHSDTIVLVEDILSAIKVSRVTNCMPMFGSDLGEERLTKIVKQFKRARVWMDPDKKKESLILSLKLSEAGLPTTVILSSKDPKDYQSADIRSIVDPLGRE